MIPPVNHPAWRELIKGETAHHFSLASASLLFFRLREQYRREPYLLEKLVGEAHRFFQKYEAIMARELEQVFSLKER